MKEREEVARKYLNKVKKHLTATRETKQKLLDGFASEMQELDGNGDYQQLTAHFGTPEEVAKELQESVPEKEYKTCKKKKKICIVAGCIVLIAAVAALVYYAYFLSSHTEVNVTETIIVESTW